MRGGGETESERERETERESRIGGDDRVSLSYRFPIPLTTAKPKQRNQSIMDIQSNTYTLEPVLWPRTTHGDE